MVQFGGAPQAPAEYGQEQFQQILTTFEQQLAELSAAIQTGYQVENYTPTRTLDASTATITDVANVLATLIQDMKSVGRLG